MFLNFSKIPPPTTTHSSLLITNYSILPTHYSVCMPAINLFAPFSPAFPAVENFLIHGILLCHKSWQILQQPNID